jgi:hypothetical protein
MCYRNLKADRMSIQKSTASGCTTFNESALDKVLDKRGLTDGDHPNNNDFEGMRLGGDSHPKS